MSYNLEATENGNIILMSEEKGLLCPFQQEDVNCGSWCALFSIRESDKTTAVKLNCSNGPEIYIKKNGEA